MSDATQTPQPHVSTEKAAALARYLHSLEEARLALVGSTLDNASKTAVDYLALRQEGNKVFEEASREFELSSAGVDTPSTPMGGGAPEPEGGPAAPEVSDDIPLYSTDYMPEEGDFNQYRKTALTLAVKIDGPFRVNTSESENEPFYCEDGYLAIDARGYPYAIATEEFGQIYRPVGDEAPSEKAPQRPADVLPDVRDKLDRQDPKANELAEAIDGYLADQG